MKPTLLITTGDVDGIGLEVTAKALLSIKKSQLKNRKLVIFISPKSQRQWIQKLKSGFKPSLVESLNQALKSDASVVLLQNSDSPAVWAEKAAECALTFKNEVVLVTAPLSKTEIATAGFKEIGHTEIFKKVCGVSSGVHMGFIGKKFGVVLATGHIALSEVESNLTESVFKSAARSCEQLRRLLPSKALQKLPIAALGLNPHAGDSGLIGNFEADAMKKWVKDCGLIGPIPPDSAFLPGSKKYSVFLAAYHDQGLIPFKSIHGQAGVHVSLGLPIKRVSVDHGTAKDIFNKNLADPSSMRLALQMALDMF